MALRLRPLLLLLAVLLAACGQTVSQTFSTVGDTLTSPPSPSVAAYPLTLTDDAKRSVTLDADPQRQPRALEYRDRLCARRL